MIDHIIPTPSLACLPPSFSYLLFLSFPSRLPSFLSPSLLPSPHHTGRVLVDTATYSTLSREGRKNLSLLEHALELKGQIVPVRPYYYNSPHAPLLAVGDDADIAAQSVVLTQNVRLGLSRQLDLTFYEPHLMRVIDSSSASTQSAVSISKNLVNRSRKGDISVRQGTVRLPPIAAALSTHTSPARSVSGTFSPMFGSQPNTPGYRAQLSPPKSLSHNALLTATLTGPIIGPVIGPVIGPIIGPVIGPGPGPGPGTDSGLEALSGRFFTNTENGSPQISTKKRGGVGDSMGPVPANVVNFTVLVGK